MFCQLQRKDTQLNSKVPSREVTIETLLLCEKNILMSTRIFSNHCREKVESFSDNQIDITTAGSWMSREDEEPDELAYPNSAELQKKLFSGSSSNNETKMDGAVWMSDEFSDKVNVLEMTDRGRLISSVSEACACHGCSHSTHSSIKAEKLSRTDFTTTYPVNQLSSSALDTTENGRILSTDITNHIDKGLPVTSSEFNPLLGSNDNQVLVSEELNSVIVNEKK